MGKRDVHVLPHEKGWAVKREDASRLSKICRNQREAIELGRRVAERLQGELVVHDERGRAIKGGAEARKGGAAAEPRGRGARGVTAEPKRGAKKGVATGGESRRRG